MTSASRWEIPAILVSRIAEQRASLALHEDRIALPYVERDDAIPCEPTGHEDK